MEWVFLSQTLQVSILGRAVTLRRVPLTRMLLMSLTFRCRGVCTIQLGYIRQSSILLS